MVKKVLVFLLIILTTYAYSKEIIIKIKENPVVSKNIVTLGDLGMVVGDKNLKNLKILKFSDAANSFFINKQLILNRIVAFYQKSKQPIPDIKIFSKQGILIKRKLYSINSDTIGKLIKNFLLSNSQKLFQTNKWEIIKVISPPNIKLPTDKVDIKVSLLNERNFGKLPFMLEFYNKAHKKLQSVRVYAIVAVKRKIVIAKRNIPMRRAILPSDVEISYVATKNNFLNYLTSLNQAIGKISKRFIRRGEPLTENIVQTPPLVKRGEIVTVIAQTNGIVITTKGKALENGFYNGSVRVLNMKSGKIFSGTVTGYGKVTVTF